MQTLLCNENQANNMDKLATQTPERVSSHMKGECEKPISWLEGAALIP